MGALSLVAALAAGVAQAQSSGAPAAAPAAKSDSFTFAGITLYGIVDIGVQYDTYGAPLSDYFPAGTTGLLQKNSRESIVTATPSNLSQSRVGLQGKEELVGGWSAVFKLETFFNPTSGDISDALKSLALNNGKAATDQATGVDSSVAGQLFAGAAYGGFSNPEIGTFTFGRQNGLLADGVAKFDPMGASNAFSVIGYSGTAAGGGDTENRRLDQSLKYVGQYGPLHLGAQYQFSNGTGSVNNAVQLVIGGNFGGGSVDVIYAKKNDAVSATALSAAQLTAATAAGFSASNSLAANITDNTTYSVMFLYNFGAPKLYAGYEHIKFANPSTPLPVGSTTIGGYVLAVANNASLPSDKTLQVSWIGLKYTVNSKFEVTGAYYRYDQNSYAVGANAGCSSNISGQCKGALNALSFLVDYRMSKRFDGYFGAMWSAVQDGLANGYLHTGTIDPTIGIRYSF